MAKIPGQKTVEEPAPPEAPPEPTAQPPEDGIKYTRFYNERTQLGLPKVELAKLAGVTDRTIARMERRKGRFRDTNYYRVLNAMNAVRKEKGLPPFTLKELFPGDEYRPQLPLPPKKGSGGAGPETPTGQASAGN